MLSEGMEYAVTMKVRMTKKSRIATRMDLSPSSGPPLSAAALASFFSFFARSLPRSVPLSSARASGSPAAAAWTGGVRSPDAAFASPVSGRGAGVLRLRGLDTMARSS
jgi:hypothetical protein